MVHRRHKKANLTKRDYVFLMILATFCFIMISGKAKEILTFAFYLAFFICVVWFTYKSGKGKGFNFGRGFNIFGRIKNEKVAELINVIKEMKPQNIESERDYEKQLFVWLDAKGYRAERQHKFGLDKQIDIIVEGIGIELKVVGRAKDLQDLIGQVHMYKKHIDNIIIVLVQDTETEQVPNYEEYVKEIKNENPEKIEIVEINTPIKRRHNKRFILVEK